MPLSHDQVAKFNEEVERLNTFSSWNVSFISKKELASNGFYYIGHTIQPDLVKCYFCNVELGNWDEGDDIEDEHRRWSPHCNFLSDPCATNNVPQDTKKLKTNMPTTCFNEKISNVVPNTIDKKVIDPKYPEYATPANRLQSYTNWPISIAQTPKALTDAGFFYTGNGDTVKCFCCGHGLKNWTFDADPLKQHEMLYSDCDYIKYLQLERIDCKSTEYEAPLCKMCLVRPNNLAFIPCGHVFSCLDCGKKFKTCPCCRQKVTECLKIYFM